MHGIRPIWWLWPSTLHPLPTAWHPRFTNDSTAGHNYMINVMRNIRKKAQSEPKKLFFFAEIHVLYSSL